MSDCEATPEVKAIIRAMAKNRVESGITDAADLVDSIHEEIHGHTPLWKSEIADIISGYGTVRKQTKDEMQIRLAAIKSELRQQAKAVDDAPNPSAVDVIEGASTSNTSSLADSISIFTCSTLAGESVVEHFRDGGEKLCSRESISIFSSFSSRRSFSSLTSASNPRTRSSRDSV